MPYLIVYLLFSSCRMEKKEVKEEVPLEECSQLRDIFRHISTLEGCFHSAPSVWQTCKSHLDTLLPLLEKGVQTESDSCNFLNHKLYPDVQRFDFVDLLSEKMIEDTLAEGIYYLIRIRGIFSEEPEISEFFSEELGRIAYRNPLIYQKYLRENPGQKEMLLNSTQWNYLNTDTLIRRFRNLGGPDPILPFFLALKAKAGLQFPQ